MVTSKDYTLLISKVAVDALRHQRLQEQELVQVLLQVLEDAVRQENPPDVLENLAHLQDDRPIVLINASFTELISVCTLWWNSDCTNVVAKKIAVSSVRK